MGKNQKRQNRSGGRRASSSRKGNGKFGLKPKLPIVWEFSAGGIIYKDDLFLLINPAGTDKWQFPKGHIEKGETAKIASIREVKEESGVNAEIIEKLGVSKYFYVWDGKRIFKSATYFLMKYVSGDIKNHDDEVKEVLFLPFNRAFEKLTYKDDKELLIKARQSLSHLLL